MAGQMRKPPLFALWLCPRALSGDESGARQLHAMVSEPLRLRPAEPDGFVRVQGRWGSCTTPFRSSSPSISSKIYSSPPADDARGCRRCSPASCRRCIRIDGQHPRLRRERGLGTVFIRRSTATSRSAHEPGTSRHGRSKAIRLECSPLVLAQDVEARPGSNWGIEADPAVPSFTEEQMVDEDESIASATCSAVPVRTDSVALRREDGAAGVVDRGTEG